MASSSAPNSSWRTWLLLLVALRLGGALSSFAVSYWAAGHMEASAGAIFIGGSNFLTNGSEAAVAFWITKVHRRLSKWIWIPLVAPSLLAALFPTGAAFIAARVADGALAGFILIGALAAVLGQVSQDPLNRRLVPLFEGIVIVTFAIGSALAGVLWHGLGVSMLAVVSILYLGVIYCSPLAESSAEKPRAAVGSAPLSLYVPVVLLSASAAMWIAQVSFILKSAPLVGQRFPGAFNTTEISEIIGGYLVLISVGLAIWSILIRRVNTRNSLLVSLGAAATAPLALAIANISSLSHSIEMRALVVYAALIILQAGVIPSLLVVIASWFSSENGPSVVGDYVVASSAGSVLGPLLGAAVATASFLGLCFMSEMLALSSFVSIIVFLSVNIAQKESTVVDK